MKTALITGATSGIGLYTALELAKSGFIVMGISRNDDSAARASEFIYSNCPQARLRWFNANLLSQSEVIGAAARVSEYIVNECSSKLDILIDNAACVTSLYMTTEDGYEKQFALNFLAHFLLTHKLLHFIENTNGRVLVTSSASHKGIKVSFGDIMLAERYSTLRAYKHTKLCLTLMAYGLREKGYNAYAFDPGLVNTDIGNKKTGGLVNFVWSVRKRFGTSPTVPAEAYANLCVQSEHPKGFYYRLLDEGKPSGEVNSENAHRLFTIAGGLCGINTILN